MATISFGLRWLAIAGLSYVAAGSALIHLANPYFFLDSVFAYGLLPDKVAIVAAAFLPYLEATIALAVWLPELRKPALGMAALLFGVYAVAQGLALARGLEIPCGCFGPASDRPISIESLSFAMGMSVTALVALVLFALADRARSKEAPHVV